MNILNSWKLWKLIVLQLILCEVTTCQNFENMSYREVEQKILENLLKSPYDKRIRPMESKSNYSTGTVVTINMFIRSFDFIDDVNMQYSIQLTFRQQWRDSRLRFEHLNPPEKLKYLTLTQSPSPIWTPDIFFSNEKSSYFHNMLVPNMFLRVSPNGDVLYSARLSMVLSCPMQLRKFPFDEQTCFMRMASYGYTTDDLIFRWKDENPLQLTPHLDLPRFSLNKFFTDKCDSVTTTAVLFEGAYSCLLMKFSLRRDSSYYNSQIFMPCVMIVIIGWLSFWINRYEASGRLVVLIATVLVMATLIGGFNDTVPKVSYTKASDVWTVSCFLFILSALFQYVIVHYLTTSETGNRMTRGHCGDTGPESHSLTGRTGERVDGEATETDGKGNKNIRRRDVDRSFRFNKYLSWTWFKEQPLGQQVDLVSRFLYPLAFLIFNLAYWPQYMDE